MKAIILNSGTGSRMGKLTEDSPKCLVDLEEGETILSYQLKILKKNEITDLLITTGPFEDQIKDYTAKNFPNLNFGFVNNPKYNQTNAIYSLYLTKNLIDDDILLMHGDMIFDEDLLKELMDDKAENTVMVTKDGTLPDKDFKGRVDNNTIKKIGVDIDGEDCVALWPVYKFSQKSFLLWMDKIEGFVNKGNVNVYAENAFNKVSDKIDLTPVDTKNRICMEIDDPQDLKVAQKLIYGEEK